VSRRTVALAASALALAAGLAVLVPKAGKRRPPAAGASVLLVTLDTLRADRLGAYGHRGGLTPHLDALAARGLLFEEGLASVPLTLPSHATILSGLEPPRHGVHDNGTYVFPREPETLATLLKARGYATGAFVGAYVLDRRFGLARGFDVYDDRIERRDEGGSVLESERPCEAVTEAAREWMGRQKGPFVAWVHLYDAHAPYAPPSPFLEAHPGMPYDGEVAHLDSCVGSLLGAARDRVLTAVVADHGEALGEHGEPTHGFFVYQSTLRVPFLLAGPGITAGERRPGPARTSDVLPTILGRLGLQAPPGLDGVDLLDRPPAGEAYAETLYPRTFGWAPLRAYRIGRRKLIDAPRAELYDLGADPGETRNLFGEDRGPASRLKQALAAFRANERAAVAEPADPEVAERLRALGYVAAAPTPIGDESALRDPKDALALFRDFEDATWAGARGEPEAAVAGLRRLVAREPDNPTFRRSLAASLRRVGRVREAAELLARLGGAAGEDAVAWHERAVALAQAGRIAEAVESEGKAIALNPLLPEPFNHLGTLEAGRGRLKEARQAFETAVALDPNNARAWNNRGNALRALGRVAEAESSYRRASELAPRDPDPLNGMGVLLVQSGRAPEAAPLFRRVLAMAPGLFEARLNLAVAEAQQGHVREARAEVDRLLAAPASTDLKAHARALLRDLARSE